MNTVGIVAEFDPFHNGHKYLIDKAKEHGDAVVCVVSGSFVQRAAPALLPARVRSLAALLNGADAVLRLPFVYAVSSAELFAASAVKILCGFGCNKICFGAETPDREKILKAAEFFNSEKYLQRLKKGLEKDEVFPVARQKALAEEGIDLDISHPNNILAVEYTKEVLKSFPEVDIIPVGRTVFNHNSTLTENGFASGSYIRELMRTGKVFSDFVPENVCELYSDCLRDGSFADFSKFSTAVLSKLRLGEGEKLFANLNTELHARLKNSVGNARDLDELYVLMKAKHYTHSRIRRAVLSEYFEITDDDLKINPPYIGLSGFVKRNEDKIRELVRGASLPVVTSYSEIKKLESKDADRVFELEQKSTDIYSLCLSTPEKCGLEYTQGIIKI